MEENKPKWWALTHTADAERGGATDSLDPTKGTNASLPTNIKGQETEGQNYTVAIVWAAVYSFETRIWIVKGRYSQICIVLIGISGASWTSPVSPALQCQSSLTISGFIVIQSPFHIKGKYGRTHKESQSQTQTLFPRH